MADTIDKPLFHSAVHLDGRASVVRTGETNIGNMLADAVRAYYNTDIAFINSGSLRCDRIIDAGVITVKDMISACRRWLSGSPWAVCPIKRRHRYPALRQPVRGEAPSGTDHRRGARERRM